MDIKQHETATWIILTSNHILRAEIGLHGINFG